MITKKLQNGFMCRQSGSNVIGMDRKNRSFARVNCLQAYNVDCELIAKRFWDKFGEKK